MRADDDRERHRASSPSISANARTGSRGKRWRTTAAARWPIVSQSPRRAQARYSATGFRKLADGRYVADGTLELRGVRKPVTLTFAWTGGAQPVLEGKAVVKRLDFGVGGGDWADTSAVPDEVNISTRVALKPI